MRIVTAREKSSPSLNLLQTRRAEKNRRFVLFPDKELK